MTTIAHPATSTTGFLRTVLKLDALASGATGLGFAAGAPFAAGLLGLPVALLVPVGVFLVAWAAGVWYVGSRRTLNRTAVKIIVAVNAIWVLDSAITLAAGWFDVTLLGELAIIAIAAVVAGFAVQQVVGLRKTR